MKFCYVRSFRTTPLAGSDTFFSICLCLTVGPTTVSWGFTKSRRTLDTLNIEEDKVAFCFQCKNRRNQPFDISWQQYYGVVTRFSSGRMVINQNPIMYFLTQTTKIRFSSEIILTELLKIKIELYISGLYKWRNGCLTIII